jgi:hypothetical protein
MHSASLCFRTAKSQAQRSVGFFVSLFLFWVELIASCVVMQMVSRMVQQIASSDLNAAWDIRASMMSVLDRDVRQIHELAQAGVATLTALPGLSCPAPALRRVQRLLTRALCGRLQMARLQRAVRAAMCWCGTFRPCRRRMSWTLDLRSHRVPSPTPAPSSPSLFAHFSAGFFRFVLCRHTYFPRRDDANEQGCTQRVY